MLDNSYYELNQDRLTDNLISLIGPTTYRSHFHKKTEITYMVEGTNLSVINNNTYFAETDDLLFVPEYYPHSYATSDVASRFIMLPTAEFEQDFNNILNNNCLPCLLNHKEFNHSKILPVLNKMHEIKNSKAFLPNTSTYLLLKGYLNIIYGLLLQEYSTLLSPKDKHMDLLTDILAYIDEHYMEKLTLDFFAKKISYNKFYFSKLFNSCIGENLCNYINNIRIKKFVELYQNSKEDNFITLAFNVGFDSMPSFYRAFNRVYDCKPKDFFKNS